MAARYTGHVQLGVLLYLVHHRVATLDTLVDYTRENRSTLRNALSKLRKHGVVSHDPYKADWTLTEAGLEWANRVITNRVDGICDTLRGFIDHYGLLFDVSDARYNCYGYKRLTLITLAREFGYLADKHADVLAS